MPKAKGHIQKEREPSPGVRPPSEDPQSENPQSAIRNPQSDDPQSGKGWRWVLIIWLIGFGLVFLVEVYIMILSLIHWFGRDG
jgi:hypothetical protein